MNRIKRLLTLLLLTCGLTTGLWASSIPGALSGRFTINASGDKVQFSKGNLQYVDENYQFAEHQYDYFGGNQYSNHVDMFANNGYSSPDGDTAWRILSLSEWSYLYTERSVTNTLSEGARYSKATIGGTYKGVIVFPDSYTHPNGTGFAGNCNNAKENYASTVSLEGWALMETAGCVFLPAAGYNRDGNIKKVDDASVYDSSTAINSESRCTPGFYYDNIYLDDRSYNTTCVPVRLVRSSLEKDAEGNYLLSSADDWKDFAAIVNNTNPAANAKMTADIDLGTQITMIASDFDHPYQGTFDGQGHTLTVNWTTNGEDRIAPFRYAEGATIKRLHVDGSISKTDAYGRCPAGILACSIGSATTTITECWSSVSLYAFDTIGGLFSVACDNSTTNIVDCVFSGMISASNSTGCSGGFASHADTEYIYTTKGAPTVNITRGLNLGTFTGANPYLSYTFIRMGNPVFGTHSINSCYYKNVYGNAQGTHATSAQLADGTIATALQNGRAEEVWVQDPLTNQPMLALFAGKYTVPASGLGTFSAKAKFALPEGLEAYYCKNYDASAGTIAVIAINGVVPAETGVLLKGEPGETYTLTTSDETPATVTDNALVAVTEQTTIQQTDGDYTNFGLSGGTFKKVNTAGGTVGANRAYLHILTSALTSEALARGISLAWDDDATMIEDLTIDGKRNADGCYDLQGRRVENPTKGLYIVNGKKVIIK